MKRPIMWIVVVLILSGWIATGITYVYFKNKQAKMETDIAILQSELQTYQFFADDVEKSTTQIGEIIRTLESLKANLEGIKNKMKRGEKQNESSQNGK
ncbi:MAG: hypothetical protein PHI44_00705 [Candidatus Ratteibacteria bacterium]|nr:hypothetical protein [Candidatus Ratteibacteria bacterium]